MTGPKEQAVRELRTKKAGKTSAKIVAKLETHNQPQCTIDHTAEGGIPKMLCVVCTPRTKTMTTATSVVTDKPRDFRIPKGMSTEEGEAMLAKRKADKLAKKMQSLASLTEKQSSEFARINALRETNGLTALPEKFIRQMRTDHASNETRFARAALQPKMETAMPAKTLKKTPVQKAPVKTTETARRAVGSGRGTSGTPRASKPANGASPGQRKGAFTPEITATLMGMLKKGTTAKAMIDTAKWGSCPNPVKRVNRFVVDVAEGQLKAKVEIEGRGEEAKYIAK